MVAHMAFLGGKGFSWKDLQREARLQREVHTRDRAWELLGSYHLPSTWTYEAFLLFFSFFFFHLF